MSFDFPERFQVRVKLPRDERGLFGRECPDCEKVFKVKPGTGLKGDDLPCHCPYCGRVAGQDHFYTKEQLKYAKSVAMRQVTDGLHNELKKHWEVKPRAPYPIWHYYEKEVETDVVCDQCTLVYAIYGEFAFCPDCGSHNSITILNKNVELVQKMLSLAENQERELAERLIGDALENLVSAFDGFGREVCKVASPKALNPAEANDVRFQNLMGAQKRVHKLFGLDFSSFISPDDWAFVCRCFEKRHLLAHKMSVVDSDYIQATKDYSAVIGRKIPITPLEVKRLGALLGQLGEHLAKRLFI